MRVSSLCYPLFQSREAHSAPYVVGVCSVGFVCSPSPRGTGYGFIVFYALFVAEGDWPPGAPRQLDL
jgi:hypothetical protein